MVFMLLSFDSKFRFIWTSRVSSYGITLRKGSPYTPFMKHIMLKVKESGQQQRIIDEYAVKANRICEQSSLQTEDDGIALSYKKLFMLFVIIAVGMIMAIIMLILEISNKRIKLKLIWKFQNPEMVTSSTQTNDIELQKQNQVKARVSKIPRLTSIHI